jgi:dolichyl-phosphate beta-glucosyltransferase
MDRTIVVIPCFDEERRLNLPAFRAYATQIPHVQFLFVNDGSRDDTLAMLEGLKREHPAEVDVLNLAHNSGKAEAVRQGVLEAIGSGRGCDFVAFWDADLSTGLDEIEPFRNIMRDRPEIEMVFGSRVNLLGRQIQRKLSRHYLGRVFATIVALALRLPIYDTQCGAKMFRVTDDLRRVFEQPFISRWIFDVEIIARFLVLRRNGSKPPARSIIVEKPLMKWTDVEGSKLRPRHFVLVIGDFVRIYSRYLRQIDGRL